MGQQQVLEGSRNIYYLFTQDPDIKLGFQAMASHPQKDAFSKLFPPSSQGQHWVAKFIAITGK